MNSDSIEREVQIDAPVETVWSIVTEPQHCPLVRQRG